MTGMEAPTNGRAVSARQSAHKGSAACVLVVDDEASVRQYMSEVLAGAGHRVVAVASAADALDALENEDVAVVVTDINMPGGRSGLQLIDALHARRPGLPIIPVTGSSDESNLRGALDRGAAGFITKPFRAAELREKVDLAISRSRLAELEISERLLAPTIASVLANAIEVRDESMEGHTERLAGLALEIGGCSGLSDVELEALELGAVLHDIGKIGIPDSILMKHGPLTAEERRVIETHPAIGDRLLEPLALLESVRPIVRNHHERWDGAGYPDGLTGEAIPLMARIVAVADSIEAMSGPRPYRSPLGKEHVILELRRGRGRQWDPVLVDRALALIAGDMLRFGPTGMTLLAK